MHVEDLLDWDLDLNEQQTQEMFRIGEDPLLSNTFQFVMEHGPEIIERINGASIIRLLRPFELFANWESKYGGNSIGVEKELLLEDAFGETLDTPYIYGLAEQMMERAIDSRFPGSRSYEEMSIKTIPDLLEICTDVCSDLGMLSENFQQLYNWLMEMVSEKGYVMRGGGLVDSRAMSTQVNLGANSWQEAVYIMNALRQHLPEFVSLFSNSNRIAASGVCSEFPQELAVEQGGLSLLILYFKPYQKSVGKPLMFTKKSTVELRCCDAQLEPEMDMAVAAYAYAIHQFARRVFPGRYPIQRHENALGKMYALAASENLKARVNDQSVIARINETLGMVDLHPEYGRPVMEML